MYTINKWLPGALLILVLTITGCNNQQTEKNVAVNGDTARKDLFLHKTSIKYAKGFSIEYHDHYKVVHIATGWKNADTTLQYVLLTKGTPRPAGYEHAQVIEIPVKSLVCLSSIYIAYVDKLNLLENLVAVDDFNYINSPRVIEMIQKKKLLQVGSNTNINVEKTIELNPDLVFTYGIGNPEYDSHPKLLEAGINVAVTVDHMENSPLGRAEWMKFMAVFFNKEKEADSLFDATVARYEAIAKMGKNAESKPTVFTEVKYGDAWYMPGGKSYIATLLADAGTNYIWADNDQRGSLKLNFEQVYTKAAEAEYWINVQFWKSLKDALKNDIRNGEFAAFKTGKIYNNNLRVNTFGGNDYWESGLINPDQLLADLVVIFHPHLLPNHQLKYYKKLL